MEQAISELEPWKKKRFRDYELSWSRAVESLSTDKPLIEVKANKSGSRWTAYDKATGKIAIFFYAAIWAWASPPDTGNFVPEGESAPQGVLEARIAPTLSNRCEISYAINTEDDPSFYALARIMEGHVTEIKAFNKYKKPRRAWQDGESEYNRRRFVLTSRLVVRRTPHNTMDGEQYSVPYDLHPWVADALNAQKYPLWLPNPELPAILEYSEGKLKMIKPTSHRYFDSGDIVWFSFALTFDVNTNNWMPEYKPLDFIRVGRITGSSDTRGEYSASTEVGSAYRSLVAGDAQLLDGRDETDCFYEDTRGKDPKRRLDEDEAMSDSQLSEESVYSAAKHATETLAPKRAKIEAASGLKPTPKSTSPDEGLKRRSNVKGKGK
ncbi:hypothetical protein C8J57DRAFT_1487629 [Mycena rebaudengoi]|nr:hypothetical protein C8J57DRAFT_1487629 [Mycena rebaudengoi]